MGRKTQQNDVYKMSSGLPQLTFAQLNWCIGQDYERSLAEYEKTKRKVSNYNYFAIITKQNDWQIVRRVIVHSERTRNGYKFGYISEVSQRWLKLEDNGCISLVVLEKQYAPFWYYKGQPYALNQPLRVKVPDKKTRRNITQFYLGDNEIYPIRSFVKGFVDSGLNKILGRCDEVDFQYDYGKFIREFPNAEIDKKEVCKLTRVCYLPTIVETLFKTGEEELARRSLNCNYTAERLKKYWIPFLIAKRNGLRLSADDWDMWFDYVSDLELIGKDIRCPKYTVPDNIGIAHAKILPKARAIRERIHQEELLARNEALRIKAEREAERRKQEAVKEEESYIKRMSKFFGLVFVTKSGLTITPLKSVGEFVDEGEAMHHCVFQMGYYKEERHCLILSAKDKDGKRVETIRVTLNNMSVAESRGVCNQATHFHNEIVKTMEDNMWQIREAFTGKRVCIAS